MKLLDFRVQSHKRKDECTPGSLATTVTASFETTNESERQQAQAIFMTAITTAIVSDLMKISPFETMNGKPAMRQPVKQEKSISASDIDAIVELGSYVYTRRNTKYTQKMLATLCLCLSNKEAADLLIDCLDGRYNGTLQ